MFCDKERVKFNASTQVSIKTPQQENLVSSIEFYWFHVKRTWPGFFQQDSHETNNEKRDLFSSKNLTGNLVFQLWTLRPLSSDPGNVTFDNADVPVCVSFLHARVSRMNVARYLNTPPSLSPTALRKTNQAKQSNRKIIQMSIA